MIDTIQQKVRGAAYPVRLWQLGGRQQMHVANEPEFKVAERPSKLDPFAAMRFGPHQVAPPMTLLGVTRLAIPGLLFEIEATVLA